MPIANRVEPNERPTLRRRALLCAGPVRYRLVGHVRPWGDVMDLPFKYRLAHIYKVDSGIFKSAYINIDQGCLCVALWLDGEEYAAAIAALEECGWHCIDDEDTKSSWRPTKHGLGSPLWLHRNTPYPPPTEPKQ